MPGVAYIRLAKNGFWKLDLSCFPVDTAGSGSRPLPSSMAAVDVVKEITGRTFLCWWQGNEKELLVLKGHLRVSSLMNLSTSSTTVCWLCSEEKNAKL